MKNVDPYAPSANVNGASIYSKACRPVKITASTIVMIIPKIVPRRSPAINE